jgi:hypothetical protein
MGLLYAVAYDPTRTARGGGTGAASANHVAGTGILPDAQIIPCPSCGDSLHPTCALGVFT